MVRLFNYGLYLKLDGIYKIVDKYVCGFDVNVNI